MFTQILQKGKQILHGKHIKNPPTGDNVPRVHNPQPRPERSWESFREAIKRGTKRFTSSSSSEASSSTSKWPNDAQESLFCDSIVALIRLDGEYPDPDVELKKFQNKEQVRVREG